MAEQDWHYAVGSEQRGPVPPEQIRGLIASGTVGPDTLVWAPSLTEWKPLSQTELASLLAGSPSAMPPVPTRAPAPQAAAPATYAPGGYGAGPQPLGASSSAPAVGGMKDAVRVCFSKFATFAGRAARPEFWWFYLAYLIIAVVASIIDGLLFSNSSGISPLQTLVSLAFLLPMIAVTVRRLHDIDKSGWWYWIVLIPIAGAIWLIVLLCKPGTPGQNQFG